MNRLQCGGPSIWAAVALLLLCPRLALSQSAPPQPPFSDPLLPGPSTPPAPAPVPTPVDPVKEIQPISPTSGGDAKSLFFNPDLGHLLPRADYRAYWIAAQKVQGQPTSLGFVRQDLSLIHPFYQDASNEWSAAFHLGNELFQTAAVLPATGRAFPRDLWNIHLSTTYRHLFENGWIAGGSVSVGSASDQPFHSYSEMTIGLNGFLRLPQGEHNAWLFTLSYANTSQVPFPLPGVAFVWQPAENFRMHIGLPFQVMYRPIDDLTLDFSYMLLTTLHAKATYKLLPRLDIYTAFDWSNEGYLLADRANPRDRLFYYDKRFSGGVKYVWSEHFSLDLATGYDFDRYWFQGQRYGERNFNRVDVGSGVFLSFQVQARW
jgi:hypothetical protein